MIKDLNVRPETVKLLEENISSTCLDISLSDDFFFNLIPKAKINKWDYNKLKSSAQQRKPSTKLKGNLANGRKYL